jgi:hypothetical protein
MSRSACDALEVIPWACRRSATCPDHSAPYRWTLVLDHLRAHQLHASDYRDLEARYEADGITGLRGRHRGSNRAF